MKAEVSRFSTEQMVAKVTKWGVNILFVVSAVILAYFSFVKTFEIDPSIRNITTIGLVSMVLNWIVWDGYYNSAYERILSQDIANKEYSVHKRYYEARKGWKYDELQKAIRNYNKSFVRAWIQDCEDVTGRTEKEMVEGGYKKRDHKMIIYKLKHRKYPKTGIKTPKDMLYILSVGKSNSMRIHTKQAERYHTSGRLRKIITAGLGSLLGASLVFEFIDGNWEGAILKVLINIVLLVTSLFFGTTAGLKGGKIKLATAEEISERLEEWKGEMPKEEPFKEEVPKENPTLIKMEPRTIEFR